MNTITQMRERRAPIARRNRRAVRVRSATNGTVTTHGAQQLARRTCEHTTQQGNPYVNGCPDCVAHYYRRPVTVLAWHRDYVVTSEHGTIDAADNPYARPVTPDRHPVSEHGIARRLGPTPDSERTTRNAPPTRIDSERLLRMRQALRHGDRDLLLRAWMADDTVRDWLAERWLASEAERQREAITGHDVSAPVGSDTMDWRTSDDAEHPVTVTRPDGSTYTYLPSDRSKRRRASGRKRQQRTANVAAIASALRDAGQPLPPCRCDSHGRTMCHRHVTE